MRLITIIKRFYQTIFLGKKYYSLQESVEDAAYLIKLSVIILILNLLLFIAKRVWPV